MNDSELTTIPSTDSDADFEAPVPTAPAVAPRKGQSRTRVATMVGSLLIGGVAGAAILGPLAANAASPTPTTTTNSGTTTTPATGADTDPNHGPGGMGFGHTEAVTDASVVAKAIGITETELATALKSGQTVAQVATARGVKVQTVIDVLVADGESELAAAVKAGTITQAQADAQKAEGTQRATNQVNGTLMGGSH